MSALLGPVKKWMVYTYGYSTRRNFDILFIEESGFEHDQTDRNTFLRYDLGLETHLNQKWSINGSFGKVYVDFGEAVITESVTDILDVSIELVFHLSNQNHP